MKKYDKALWEERLGPESKWGKDHEIEDKVDKIIQGAKEKAKDILYDYVEPVKGTKKTKFGFVKHFDSDKETEKEAKSFQSGSIFNK